LPVRYEFGEFTVSPEQRQVLRDGVAVPLGARAFDLLACLIARRDRVVGKTELLDQVWPGMVVTENNLNAQVMALRKALGPRIALTVAGRGFQFGLPVTLLGAVGVDGQDRRQRKSRRDQADAGNGLQLAPDLPLPDKPSIAVLPFANLGGGLPDDFADGITEDITTELSRFRSLFVIARNSAFTFKGHAVDVRTAARRLGVRYVLEGSVRHAGPRIRVTAQLIDGLTGSHLWAEKYDRFVTDVFGAQEELTMSIVSAMAPQIAASESGKARLTQPRNLNAHGLAQRSAAMQHSQGLSGDRAAFDEALRLAREAVKLDASSAFTWRVLAGALWLQIYYNFAASAAQALAEGLDASSRAVALDANDHFALTIKGLLALLAGQGEAGLLSLRRSHELNPNDAYTLAWLAFYEATAGDASRAEQHGLDALRLSPCDPMRPGFLLLMSGVYFSAADYATGLRYAQRSLLESPDTASPHVAIAINWVGLGDIDAARAACAQALHLAPRLVESRLAGVWPSPGSSYHQRAHRFLRMAANLADRQST
jgi:TolB-like protein